MESLVVAIDGPSGSGKSSTAKAIASRGNWKYLDTGALYRAATWLAQQENLHQGSEIVEALRLKPIIFSCNPKDPKISVGERDVTAEIRSLRVTDQVSQFSALPELRKYLIELQRSIISQASNGIVVEGRDIGTVVVPDAQLKVFLFADLQARTARRELEMTEVVSKKEIADSLATRDQLDSSRPISPLRPAADALELDSTNLAFDEVVDVIWDWLGQKNLLGLPKVAIIGRPNVGKSTLVNRIIGRREAIVEDTPGVTRDRIRYEAEWNSRRFILIDTGGWERVPEGIAEQITVAAERAIVESDLVLFVIDAHVGAITEDESLLSILRKSGKKIILVANKVDNEVDESDAHSLWNLGVGEPHFISALHGRGAGDLLDLITSELPEVGSGELNDGFHRIALVGRPNVGKSSLLNVLAGEPRVIVDAIAGTTRDPVDELIKIDGEDYKFVDTAGIRRRSHQDSGTDYYASLRTASAIERSELALVLFDASEILTEQDLRILTMVEEMGRALVIVMNKWDLVDEDRRSQLESELDRNLNRYPWAQIVNVSALTGWHRDRLGPAIRSALTSWEKRIPTSKLNAFLGSLVSATPPPVRGGKQPKIKFATQAGSCPPKFVIFASGFIEQAYRKFIERRLREEFGFQGSPVEVVVKVKDRD
jgi:GTPase